MDAPTLHQALTTLALAVALAACAGLRAWLPLLLAGLLARTEVLTLGPAFGFLSSIQALLVFGTATLIEIVGDKIPVVDHALDALGTVLRPTAGALLAASVIGRFEDPLTAMVLGVVVGAPSALVPHAAKTVLRGVSTAFTGGIANPILSLIEDVFAFVLFVLAVLIAPVIAAALAVAAVVVCARMTSRRPAAPKCL